MITDRSREPEAAFRAELARIEAQKVAPESYACTCGHDGLSAEWHAGVCGTAGAREDMVERVARALGEVPLTVGPLTAAGMLTTKDATRLARVALSAVHEQGRAEADRLRERLREVEQHWADIAGDTIGARTMRACAAELRAALSAVHDRNEQR